MTTTQTPLTASDFSSANFPEFHHGDIMKDVLIELNTVVQHAIAEQGGASSDTSCEELIECLRSDIVGSPYLYLSDSLIDRLKTASPG